MTAARSIGRMLLIFSVSLTIQHRFDRVVKISDGYQYQLKNLTGALQEALANVKTLKGFIPICASCKKVRADDGSWRQIEQYLDENSEASLSHGLCPECTTNYFITCPHCPAPPGQRTRGFLSSFLQKSWKTR